MLKISTLNRKERIALEDFRKRIERQLRGKVISIKLFGSKARGDFRKDSDLDVLVVLKGNEHNLRDRIYDIVTEVLLEYDVYISVKVYFEDEFKYLNSLPTIFMQLVNRDGIPL
ncbi:MAG: nucleotidyltransferase domain-containing protein [Candidatus Omnitrophica bacterium]|nr:nucleotidyltransferase domain-containing protein [Candidatus Omnitrophota bacterium]